MLAEIGRKRGNSALTRQVIPENDDSLQWSTPSARHVWVPGTPGGPRDLRGPKTVPRKSSQPRSPRRSVERSELRTKSRMLRRIAEPVPDGPSQPGRCNISAGEGLRRAGVVPSMPEARHPAKLAGLCRLDHQPAYFTTDGEDVKETSDRAKNLGLSGPTGRAGPQAGNGACGPRKGRWKSHRARSTIH